jgi:hypothetical protein|tara:strand:- start:3320 stop:3532 length:213 start_codon:yes stop_codon:yes gene_type:complete
VKKNCDEFNPCPHGKRKGNCTACTPCPHGKLKKHCAACKAARTGQPGSLEIKQEPEAFTIRGYFGFDDGQ